MLTTVVRAKKLMGMIPEEDESRDFEIDMLLEVASQRIESHCKRTFKLQQHEQILDGSGTAYLILRDFPVHNVQSLQICGQDSNDFRVIGDQGLLYRKIGWDPGRQNISVVYEAGYVLPEDETAEKPATLPKPLEYACILFAKMMLEEKVGVTKERLGDWSVEYAAESQAEKLPLAVAALISPYARRLA